MDKPRKPGKNAGPNVWDRYHTDMATWQAEQGAARRQPGAIMRGVAAAGIVGAVGTAADQPVQTDTNTHAQ